MTISQETCLISLHQHKPTRIGRCTNGYYINVTSLSASPYPKAMLFYFSEVKKRVNNLLKKGSFN